MKESISSYKMFFQSLSLVCLINYNLEAGKCCVPKKLNDSNNKNLKIKVINDNDLKNKKDLNSLDINGINNEEYYKNLGEEYFSNIISENNKKNDIIKEHVKKINETIIKNLKGILVFNKNKNTNNEKDKNKLFEITLDEAKEYIDNEIDEFFKRKGYKDYFLISYILFKINKSIIDFKNTEAKKNISLNDIVVNLNYSDIIKENGKNNQIDKIIYKNQSEFIDFNDIDLIDYSLRILNKVRYCFLVYLILVTNEFFDKFPFLVNKKVETIGKNVFNNQKPDKVTLFNLLSNMVKNLKNNANSKGKIDLDIYIKMAKTRFFIIKEMYNMLNKIENVIISENHSKLMLINNNGKENNIETSCQQYKNFYDYSIKNKNELHSYIKEIFSTKIKTDDKKDIDIYNILKEYEKNKEIYNGCIANTNLKKFSKIKITELTEAYNKLNNNN